MDNHIVMLIGDEPSGDLNKVRSQHPHLDIRAKHSDLACLHCGEYFPLSAILPAKIDMITVISKQFTKEHRHCKPNQTSVWCLVDNG